MKLDTKKKLAARTLNVGLGRIAFDNNRLEEIKEAITKQDINDLFSSGAIKVKPINGRRKKENRKTRKRQGKVKLKPNRRKQEYVIITRKLRRYLRELKEQGKVNEDKYKELMKKIKMKNFRNKRHFKEAI
jgi:large subunit ribosomal protein L19e